jgi:hypothetical protein
MAGEKSCTPEEKKAADLNKDGKVNKLDYDVFVSHSQ